MSEFYRNYATATTRDLQLYANGTTGSDANDGLSLAQAKKTRQAVYDLIPDICNHNVVVNLAGTFTEDTDHMYLASRHIAKNVTLRIDGGDGLNEVVASMTSTDPETDTTKIGDSGQAWTVDLYKGQWVEITSGPASGEIRSIFSNTATELTVATDFSTDPGVCSFRIVEPLTHLNSATKYERIRNNSGLGFIVFQRLRWSTRAPWFEKNTNQSCALVACVINNPSNYLFTQGNLSTITFGKGAVNPVTHAAITGHDASTYVEGQTIGEFNHAQFNGIASIHGEFIAREQVAPALLGCRADFVEAYDCSLRSPSSLLFNSFAGWRTCQIGDSASGVALRLFRSNIQIGDGTLNISNAQSHAIEVDGGWLKLKGDLLGSGNTGASIRVKNGAIVDFSSTVPAITSTVGDISFDGTTEQCTFENIVTDNETYTSADGSVVYEGGVDVAYRKQFAEIKGVAVGTALALTLQSTWYKVATYSANGRANGLEADETLNHIVCRRAVEHRVKAMMNFYADVSQDYEIAICEGDPESTGTVLASARLTYGATSTFYDQAFLETGFLAAASDQVGIWVQCHTAAAQNFNPYNFNLLVEEVL